MEVGSSSKGKETTNTQRANIQSSDIPSDSNPNPSSIGSSTPYHTSRLAKLDGVLFHFYSKTSAVITQSRLSHYSESHSGQSGSTSSNEQVASQSQNQRKASKWVSIWCYTAVYSDSHELRMDKMHSERSIEGCGCSLISLISVSRYRFLFLLAHTNPQLLRLLSEIDVFNSSL